ncbi:MAG TPA: DUF302 domain-containing protein [Bryobacteraceae bacterium]|nr:DUF302 domain-containing protein [Bryobacteraceae bacterium]
MLQIRSAVKLEDIESVLKAVAHLHNANVTVISHLGRPHDVAAAGGPQEALVFTFFHPKLHTALLSADIRFAGFLPCRVAAWPAEDGVMLQALLPSEFCRILERMDLEPMATPLDGVLRGILEAAAKPLTAAAKSRPGVETSRWGATEDQVNMQATVAQRIDYRGTKIEDEAGTGTHDSPGG